jgi:hypothetical protein
MLLNAQNQRSVRKIVIAGGMVILATKLGGIILGFGEIVSYTYNFNN